MNGHGLREKEKVIQLGKTGIVYEDFNNIDQSPFRDVYNKAFKLTKTIIMNQRKVESKGQSEQIDNIITFVGRRGTGKTSAMLSFMDFLKNNIGHYNDMERIKKYCIENSRNQLINFIALEWIDASLLEDGEDIFEYILAKMLRDVLNLDDEIRESGFQNYEIRELHQDFSSIYEKVLKLKNRGSQDVNDDRMSISKLRDLARSSDMRKEFEELIQRYLQIKINMDRRPGVKSVDDACLVVAIDDMDMNVESGFEILEKIQRYLKVKGLVVLIAINDEQVKTCCEKHFSNIYEFIPKNDLKQYGSKISKIAAEYMEKALPIYMRVYLPSIKKKDYDIDWQTKVKLSLQDDISEPRTIKETLFHLYEHKTMVRYDSQGKKRHFIEPNTLRQLNSEYLLLTEMENVKTNSYINFMIFDQNIKLCMDDILYRFALENLPQREFELFQNISELNLVRRGRAIVKLFSDEINKQNLDNLIFAGKFDGHDKKFYPFLEELEIFNYSYGELMRCLYFMGRESNILSKKLVHAILAMYTLTLTKIYYRYKKADPELRDKKSNYKILKDILSESAGGSWSMYFVPIDGELPIGAVRQANFNLLSIEIDSHVVRKLHELKNIDGPNSTNKLVEAVSDVVNSMDSQIIMRLFFSNFKSYSLEKGKSYDFDIDVPATLESRKSIKEDEITNGFRLKFKNFNADFNVMNFINNIFIFEEVMDEFIEVILGKSNVIINANKHSIDYSKLKSKKDSIIRKVKDNLQKNKKSFYYNMCEWTERTGGAVVPFYSTDIYYNMLKRLERECEIENGSDDYFKQLLKLLERIESHLKRSDSFYKKQNDEESYAYVFNSCPAIQKIRDEKNRQLQKIFNRMVAAVAATGSQNRAFNRYKYLIMKYTEE